jgi:hypothetical protein
VEGSDRRGGGMDVSRRYFFRQIWLRSILSNHLACCTTKNYYKEGVYRTPYLMSTFSHNTLILKEKKLLIIDEKGENLTVFPSGGAAGSRTLQ